MIKFAHSDVISGIEIIKTTSWYGEMDFSRKERIEKTLFKLKMEHDNSLKGKSSFFIHEILESNEHFGGDTLLVLLIKKSVGSYLLLQGKALVWRRADLKLMNPILFEQRGGEDACKFFFENGEQFFSGFVLNRGQFSNSADLDLKLSLRVRNDSGKNIGESLLNGRKITGRIFEKVTGNPIKDATVSLLNSKLSTVTDSLGYFEIDADSINTLIVKTKYYEPYREKVLAAHNISIRLKRIIGTEIVYPNKFPGGLNKFYEYVKVNIKYPKDAFKKRIEGRVLLQFVVDSTGRILPNEIKVISGLSKSCDEEAVRLLRESPKWLPLVLNGRPIQRKESVYIKFP